MGKALKVCLVLGLCLVVGGCLLGMAGYAFEENRASDYVQRQGPQSPGVEPNESHRVA